MKRIDYYFSNEKNEKRLQKLVETPLFQQLVAFFRQQNGDAILLRRIKEAIVTDENIEHILEEMITYNLLERYERKYKLLLPIYEGNLRKRQIAKNSLKELADFSKSLSLLDRDQFLGEWLWNECFPKVGNYCFGVEREAGEQDDFFTKIVAGNDELSFITIKIEATDIADIPSYFSNLTSNHLPKRFQPLHQLVGDVDLNYYITQAKRVIKNAEKHRKAAIKSNIFQDSLVEVGVIALTESKELALQTSVIKKLDYTNLVPGMEIVASILKEFNETKDLSINERVLANNYLYQQIFAEIAQDQKVISYIRTDSQL